MKLQTKKKFKHKEGKHMEMQYRTMNGMNLPDLTPPEEPMATGKYAMLRESYLQEHRHSLYLNLLTSGQLNQHLMEVQNRASQMLEDLMPKLQREAGVTEELKARNPMEWTGLMNNLRNNAEETILAELVYS